MKLIKRCCHEVCADSRLLRKEVEELKSSSKYKLKLIQDLGEFSGNIPIERVETESNSFLNPLCAIDDNNNKIYFTNESQTTNYTNWLQYNSPDRIAATAAGLNHYNLYTNMTKEPYKCGDVYVTGNSLLYLHNSMVDQNYDLVTGNNILRITVREKERFSTDIKTDFIREIVKRKPDNIIDYLRILYDVHDLDSYSSLEVIHFIDKRQIAKVVMKSGELEEYRLPMNYNYSEYCNNDEKPEQYRKRLTI